MTPVWVASGPTSPKIKFEALPVSTETATMTGRTGSGSENWLLERALLLGRVTGEGAFVGPLLTRGVDGCAIIARIEVLHPLSGRCPAAHGGGGQRPPASDARMEGR